MTAPACPICGKKAGAGVEPFCSARCRDVDLNRWLGGVYAIRTDEKPADNQEKEDRD